MPNPLVSIVTITLNSRDLLESTINNVTKQSYKNIEYVVIDGGSSDKSVEVIKQYKSHISYWVSESDEGISDAFNKGLSASTGDWIIFLNAGDLFANENIVENWVAGVAYDVDIITSFACYKNNEKILIPKKIVKNNDPLPIKSLISHQATIVRRNIYDRYGGFNNNYKVRMDYEFWLRVLKHVRFEFVPIVAIVYDTSGLSFVNKKLFYEEERRANSEHLMFSERFYWNNRLQVRKLVKNLIGRR